MIQDSPIFRFGTKMSEVQILSARLVEKPFGIAEWLFHFGASVDLKGKRSEPRAII